MTSDRSGYSAVAIGLHWLVFVCIVANWLLGLYMVDLSLPPPETQILFLAQVDGSHNFSDCDDKGGLAHHSPRSTTTGYPASLATLGSRPVTSPALPVAFCHSAEWLAV